MLFLLWQLSILINLQYLSNICRWEQTLVSGLLFSPGSRSSRQLFACRPRMNPKRQQCKLINLQTASICLRGGSQTTRTNKLHMHQSSGPSTQPSGNPGEYPDYPGISTVMLLSTHHWRGIAGGVTLRETIAHKQKKRARQTIDEIKLARHDSTVSSIVDYCFGRQPRSKSKITAQSPRRSDKTWQRIVACDWSERAWKKTIGILIVSVQSRLDGCQFMIWTRGECAVSSLDDEVQVCCQKSHRSR